MRALSWLPLAVCLLAVPVATLASSEGPRGAQLRRPELGELYGDSWAVVIGIDKYRQVGRLTYAVRDAQAIEKALRIHGFRNIRLILNDAATAKEIRGLLGDELPRRVKPNDRVVIFFAGHGETRQLSEQKDMGYLIPVDGDLDAIHATSISMNEITDFANIINAKHVLFLLDACYGGLALRSASAPARQADWVFEVARKSVRQVITAGGKDEKVIEVGGHGLFTTFVLKALDGDDAAGTDGIVTATQLGGYLQRRVAEASSRYGHPHTPLYGRISGDGDLVFVRPGTAAALPSSAVAPPPAPPVKLQAPAPNPTPPVAAAPPRPTRPASQPQTGSVEVRTNVPGVEIWIGNQRIGETVPGTPLVAGPVAAGTYQLRALKPGHRNIERPVVVVANDVARIDLNLERIRRDRLPRDYGESLMKDERWAEAEAAFHDAVEAEPRNARWHGHLGIALARQDRWTEAERPFRTAAQLDNRNPIWRMNLGLALELQRKWSEAEAAYREALRFEPRVARWQGQLGDVLNAQQKWGEAATAFRHAVSLEHHTARYHAELALALAKQAQWADAEVYGRQAIRQEPGKALWHARLGETLRNQAKWPQAAVAFGNALRLEPGNSRYQERLSEAQERQR